MQLVGSLYVLYFPYCGFILWEACSAGNQHRLHAHPRIANVASLLLAFSPPINCVLYGLKSQTLRRSLQNYWRKKVTKSELQQVTSMQGNATLRIAVVRRAMVGRLRRMLVDHDISLHLLYSSFIATWHPHFRRYRRERQASQAREDLPVAGTFPSSLSRPYSGDSARRYWPSARAEPAIPSKAIISDSSAADCNPPPRATPSECRPSNQVRKVVRFACRYLLQCTV